MAARLLCLRPVAAGDDATAGEASATGGRGVRSWVAQTDGSAAAELVSYCERWTPVWEARRSGVYLDLTGMARLLGGDGDGAAGVCRQAPKHWGPLSAGLGGSTLVALLAARLAGTAPGRLLVVPPGNEARFLAPFAVSVLGGRFPAEVVRLQQLGVRTLGDLQVVPTTLLVATLGSVGVALAATAEGQALDCLQPDRHRRPEDCVVVRARWRRPLAGALLESALRRAVARRAMLACAGGPGCWQSWCWQSTWAGGDQATTTLPGRGADTWPVWLDLVEQLWRRLPVRRRGLVALELRAGRRCPDPGQGSLFPDPERERALALAAGWRRVAGLRLGLACEAALATWNICWDGAAMIPEAS
jgi:hypothetical protein